MAQPALLPTTTVHSLREDFEKYVAKVLGELEYLDREEFVQTVGSVQEAATLYGVRDTQLDDAAEQAARLDREGEDVQSDDDGYEQYKEGLRERAAVEREIDGMFLSLREIS